MTSTSRFTFCMLRRIQYLNLNFQKLYGCVLSSNVRNISTETLQEKTETPHEKTETPHEKVDVKIREKIQLRRPAVTKWKRPLFVQNLFVGKFDTQLMSIPEILDNEHLEDVEKYVTIVNEIYKTKVNSLKIDADQRIPSDVLQEFKNLGLCGRFAPLEYGGLELTYTEYARLNEAIGLDWSIGTVLNVHELVGIKAFSLLGTSEQKEKYLSDLASGRKIATFCCHEQESGSDASAVKTQVMLTPDGLNYIVTGVKTWVTNAADADLYLVLVKTPKRADAHESEPIMLIIDKNTPGVKVSLISDNTSLRGTGVGIVEFDEVVVPIKNVLGEVGVGFGVYNKFLENMRFGIGSLYIGTLKTLLDHVTEYVIHTERNEKTLGNYELVKMRLSKIAQRIYAMESITYFTAAIYDSTDEPDCSLESAIMKVYNSEGALYCLQELMKVIGIIGLAKSQQLERFYRDAQGMAMLDLPNDMVRLYIGLSGVKYTGSLRYKEVEEWRNPLVFPWKNILYNNRYRRIARKKFSYSHDIGGHVHPSLVAHGNSLEESLQLFDACVNCVLKDYGIKVLEHQLDPCRLADMAINLYVMTAVLSRSSRSYCIGLKNNDQELKVAFAICREARQKIDAYYKDVTHGSIANYDGKHIGIGENVIDLKGFFPEHPLKHNW